MEIAKKKMIWIQEGIQEKLKMRFPKKKIRSRGSLIKKNNLKKKRRLVEREKKGRNWKLAQKKKIPVKIFTMPPPDD